MGYLPHELADLLNDSLQPTWEAFAVGAGQACLAETLAAAEDVDRIIEVFPQIVANLRRLSPYWDQEKNAPTGDVIEAG